MGQVGHTTQHAKGARAMSEQNITNDAENRGAQGNFYGEVKFIYEAARTHPDDPRLLAGTIELWKSLVDVKNYLQYGIVEQTKSKTSFGADDALPIITAYRNFEEAKPYLSTELIEAVQSALNVAETGFNDLLNVFRSATSLPSGDSPQRTEYTRLAYETLNRALREYHLQLTKIESLLSVA
jgi:hypothetical protein